jgi:cobalt transporter subunit CbtB
MPSTPRILPVPSSDLPAELPAWRAAIGAIVVGAVLVFVAGFAQIGPIHDGAHDARHGAAFPCH